MATFTFRISDGLAGRLTSAEMRSWLSDFLRNPQMVSASQNLKQRSTVFAEYIRWGLSRGPVVFLHML